MKEDQKLEIYEKAKQRINRKKIKLQIFPIGSFVYVTENMPVSMSHFKCDFIGIVQYTYSEVYGGNEIDSYSIIQLNDKGIPINSISWYHGKQLSLISKDTETGIKIIKDFNK